MSNVNAKPSSAPVLTTPEAVSDAAVAEGQAYLAAQAKRIAELEALVAGLKASKSAAAPRVTVKLSEKGGISVYGFGRFPVTLYRSQMERFTSPETVKMIRDFMETHREALDAVEARHAAAKLTGKGADETPAVAK